MIKNERQYRITKAQSERFAAALAELGGRASDAAAHPLVRKAQADALKSQYDDLRREVAEYEALRAGADTVLVANSWRELPDALIRARIAAGMSQKDLADRLGLKEQQVQRYETTGYSAASFERLGEVISALGVQVREEVYLPSSGVSLDALVRRVSSLGFSAGFVREKLFPKPVREGGAGDAGALAAASQIGRVFGWSPTALFGPGVLAPPTGSLAAARLRARSNARVTHTTAYAVYAHYLCLLLLDATRHVRAEGLPRTGAEAYRAILAERGSMGFEEALRYVWGLGIPVLPLGDGGAFHGACWRSAGRNVICLKHTARFESRWLDVLLHELGHATQHPDEPEFGVIEEGDTLEERRDSPDEKEAVRYAAAAALGGRAEELAAQCVSAAGGSVERLKRAVPDVARRNGVPADLLANYMAFRLSLQGTNWWGAATNLQPAGQNPWMLARDVLLEHADLSSLAEPDRDLLVAALSESETSETEE